MLQSLTNTKMKKDFSGGKKRSDSPKSAPRAGGARRVVENKSNKPSGGFERPARSFDKPSTERKSYDKPESRFGKPTERRSYDKPAYDKPRGDSDRPTERRSYDKSAGGYDKPRRDFDKPTERRSYDKPAYDKPRGDSDRPTERRTYDKPAYDKPRGDSDRPTERRSYDKPAYDKPRGDFDRPKRSFDKPAYDKPRGDFDGPKRSYDKPAYDKPRGDFDGPKRSYDKPAYDKPRGDFDRPKRSFDKPTYDKPRGDFDKSTERRSYDKPAYDKPRGDFDKSTERRSFDKPAYDKPRGDFDKSTERRSYDKPAYDKPRGDFDKSTERRSYDKPAYDKPRGDFDKSTERRSFDKPAYDKPRGDFDRPKRSFDKPEGGFDAPKRGFKRNDSVEKSSEESPKREKRIRTTGSVVSNFGGKKMFEAHDRFENSDKRTPKYDIDRFKENAPAKIKRRFDEVDGKPSLGVRLNRYISNSGVCSRREADELISSGQIKVNGKVVDEMGYQVQPGDVVKYGSRKLTREKMVYLLLNKPKDFITTTEDPNDRKTVMELVENACEERIYPVGRLDRNTTGLLLITNDGELADKLTHPSNGIEKMYQVEIDKPLTPEHYDMILKGITLEDGEIKADDLGVVTPDRMVIGLKIHSGRNHIVRRIFAHLGYDVLKLDRTTFAGLNKKDLPRGKWRFLSEKEVIKLKYFV
jgi:23S rRNA pseudouridine2605 synthase